MDNNIFKYLLGSLNEIPIDVDDIIFSHNFPKGVFDL